MVWFFEVNFLGSIVSKASNTFQDNDHLGNNRLNVAKNIDVLVRFFYRSFDFCIVQHALNRFSVKLFSFVEKFLLYF